MAELNQALLSKALKILSQKDFIDIDGRPEIKADSLKRFLSEIPASYQISIIHQEETEFTVKTRIRLTIKFYKTGIERTAEATGVCEKKEILHDSYACSETRALKRAVEIVFGPIINQVVQKLFNEV